MLHLFLLISVLAFGHYPEVEYFYEEAWEYAEASTLDLSPYPDDATKEEIRPYLLPADHPAYLALDPLFRRSHVTYDQESFTNAGFVILCAKRNNKLIVGYHPSCPEYVVKFVPDCCRIDVKLALITRAEVARRMRAVIHQYSITKIVTPDKWIYPLPPQPKPPHLVDTGREFLLVETRLDILDTASSRAFWKNGKPLSKEMLHELYTLLKNVPLRDTTFRNVRFTKDLKHIALFDFQYPSNNLDDFNTRIAPFLPAKWRRYWFSRVSFVQPTAL